MRLDNMLKITILYDRIMDKKYNPYKQAPDREKFYSHLLTIIAMLRDCGSGWENCLVASYLKETLFHYLCANKSFLTGEEKEMLKKKFDLDGISPSLKEEYKEIFGEEWEEKEKISYGELFEQLYRKQ